MRKEDKNVVMEKLVQKKEKEHQQAKEIKAQDGPDRA